MPDCGCLSASTRPVFDGPARRRHTDPGRTPISGRCAVDCPMPRALRTWSIRLLILPACALALAACSSSPSSRLVDDHHHVDAATTSTHTAVDDLDAPAPGRPRPRHRRRARSSRRSSTSTEFVLPVEEHQLRDRLQLRPERPHQHALPDRLPTEVGDAGGGQHARRVHRGQLPLQCRLEHADAGLRPVDHPGAVHLCVVDGGHEVHPGQRGRVPHFERRAPRRWATPRWPPG